MYAGGGRGCGVVPGLSCLSTKAPHVRPGFDLAMFPEKKGLTLLGRSSLQENQKIKQKEKPPGRVRKTYAIRVFARRGTSSSIIDGIFKPGVIILFWGGKWCKGELNMPCKTNLLGTAYAGTERCLAFFFPCFCVACGLARWLTTGFSSLIGC
ncbi:hypothetical protein B0F90DRAFT_341439 [Multifurca ochricompacta]|uniref:Uncharacterized protein n=1 Tax=Multifurca ochricompacta TaxID=376703 RepID=A0AAD4LXK9_9AGAM|nr:hypothetical protein B0F90DRAFT_341439 [Multifurca ochricompacta]